MSAGEKAKQAREAINAIDPRCVEVIDACRAAFGAKLTGLKGAGLTLGTIDKTDREWESTPPLARYYRPEEAAAEWDRIRRSVPARAAPRAGASGGKGRRARR